MDKPRGLCGLLFGQEQGQKVIGTNLVIQICLSFCLYLIFFFNKGKSSSETFYVLFGFVVFLIVQYYFAYHSILKANAFELSAFIAMSVLTWLGVLFKSIPYCINVLKQGNNLVGAAIIICDVLLTVNLICYFMYSPSLFKVFKWRVYHSMGASREMQRTFATYETYKTLTKLTAAMTIVRTFATVYEDGGFGPRPINLAIDFPVLFFAILFILLGYHAASKKNRTRVVVFLISTILFEIYREVRLGLFFVDSDFDTGQQNWELFIGLDFSNPKIGLILLSLLCDIIGIAINVLAIIYGARLFKLMKSDLYKALLEKKRKPSNSEEEKVDQEPSSVLE